MLLKQFMLATALAATSVAGLPGEAEAHGRGHGWHKQHRGHGWGHYKHNRGYYDGGYYRQRGYYGYGYDRPRYRCRSSGTTGLIIGGAAGALLGREVDRYGDRAPGTIIGGAAGALLGREIARKDRC